jgi:hypothetical protein
VVLVIAFLLLQRLTLLAKILNLRSTESLETLSWKFIKQKLLAIVNKISPLQSKLVKSKENDQFSWIDFQVLKAKRSVDKAYKLARTVDSDHVILNKDMWLDYTEKRNKLNKLKNAKMIAYFQNKTMQDFKNSKKFS